MPVDRVRSLLLFLFTAAAFVTLGRAPGPVRLQTRDFEMTIQGETRPGRDRRAMIVWLDGSAPA